MTISVERINKIKHLANDVKVEDIILVLAMQASTEYMEGFRESVLDGNELLSGLTIKKLCSWSFNYMIEVYPDIMRFGEDISNSAENDMNAMFRRAIRTVFDEVPELRQIELPAE